MGCVCWVSWTCLPFFYLNEMTRSSPTLFEKKENQYVVIGVAESISSTLLLRPAGSDGEIALLQPMKLVDYNGMVLLVAKALWQ